MAEEYSEWLKPPPPNLCYPWEHGNDVVHVRVSNINGECKNFTMHRDLLTRNSPYLQKLLNSKPFVKPDTIQLSSICPTAFEVIYQWFYSGGLFDEYIYIDAGEMESDVFWLRAYKIARLLKIRSLPEKIQGHIEEFLHHPRQSDKPSNQFLQELYTSEAWDVCEAMRSNCVTRTARTLKYRDLSPPEVSEWKLLFEDLPEFAAVVLNKVCEL